MSKITRGNPKALKNVRGMGNDQALDYLGAKFAETKFRDRSGGYSKGIGQFIDEKSYRPGLAAYRKD